MDLFLEKQYRPQISFSRRRCLSQTTKTSHRLTTRTSRRRRCSTSRWRRHRHRLRSYIMELKGHAVLFSAGEWQILNLRPFFWKIFNLSISDSKEPLRCNYNLLALLTLQAFYLNRYLKVMLLSFSMNLELAVVTEKIILSIFSVHFTRVKQAHETP